MARSASLSGMRVGERARARPRQRARHARSTAAVFRLLGFDVASPDRVPHFMALVAFINPGRVRPLARRLPRGVHPLHELGHAFAARQHGADAAISLDFLAGYTSFRPDAPAQQATAGADLVRRTRHPHPVSVAVLAAMGVNPLDSDSYTSPTPAVAIWWAGPVIGLLNLIPVLPLDGGHLAQTGFEVVLGRSRACATMAIASLVITVGAAVCDASSPATRGFTIFIAFLLFCQFQMLQATSQARAGPHARSPCGSMPSARWLHRPARQVRRGKLVYHGTGPIGRTPSRARRGIDRCDLVRSASSTPAPLVRHRRGPARGSSKRSSHCSPAASRPATRYSEYRAGDSPAAHRRDQARRRVRRRVVLAHRTPLLRDRRRPSGGRDGRPGERDATGCTPRRRRRQLGGQRPAARRRRARSRAGAGRAARRRRSRAARTLLR